LHWIIHNEPGSSVGIATDYGLDGPGSNPNGDEIFRPSRPALGHTPLPGVDPPPHLVPKVLEKSISIPLLTLRAFVAYKKGENLPNPQLTDICNMQRGSELVSGLRV